ncbi:MAG: hypothetical protein ACE5PM_08810 [Candidatus Hydrothermarchaeales archaeon]
MLGSPWRTSRRGRGPEFTPKEHAAICIYVRYFNYSYGNAEGAVPPLISRIIDYSTMGWAMKRLPYHTCARS